MADGIAVGLPGRRHVRGGPRRTSTRSSPSPRSRCRGRCSRCSSAPRWSSSRPVRRRSRRSWTHPTAFATPGGGGALRRQHRPAAARQGDPARHGRGRPLPQPARLHPRPPRRAGHGCSPSSADGRRQRARGRARADLAARCTSTRSRCTSSSRPAARSTPSGAGPAPRARLPRPRVTGHAPARRVQRLSR